MGNDAQGVEKTDEGDEQGREIFPAEEREKEEIHANDDKPAENENFIAGQAICQRRDLVRFADADRIEIPSGIHRIVRYMKRNQDDRSPNIHGSELGFPGSPIALVREGDGSVAGDLDAVDI